MASIISGAGDFKVIPLDSECLFMAELRSPDNAYERLYRRKQTIRFDLSAMGVVDIRFETPKGSI